MILLQLALLATLQLSSPIGGDVQRSPVTSSLGSDDTNHSARVESALLAAGDNRAQIESALTSAPEDQRSGMSWLVAHMPKQDLRTISSAYLLENCDAAYKAWRAAPWHDQVSDDLFLDCILPYASINEPRDQWRKLLGEKCQPLIAGAKTPGAAAVILNQKLFPLVGVKYSTKRKRADQSPSESMESGLASCTGLSILLVDACRSVGIPARFAGTPLWVDKSGNHSWVEVWDGDWHYTGAAEPTENELDKAWFTDKAATARGDEPLYSIYAVTWQDSPITFPTGWRDEGEQPENSPVRAVNVTARYMAPTLVVPAGMARVKFRASLGEERQVIAIVVRNSAGAEVFRGTTKGEGADANDHLTAELPLGGRFSVTGEGVTPTEFAVDKDEQIVQLAIGEPAPQDSPRQSGPSKQAAPPTLGGAPRQPSTGVIKDLRVYLAKHGLDEIENQPWASTGLTKDEAALASDLLWKSYSSRGRAKCKKELESGLIVVDGIRMPIWYKSFGKKPKSGWSLYISMHGGGGAPKRVNDQQWENQKRLYEPAEGIYVAPRAPTDNWNLWHESHIDPLFTKLIADMIIAEGVNPDRVYIMGYSAGGDGVYQLAPRMADQLAAAAMMAGHPNESQPDGLRNLPFTIHVGADDTPFKRNEIAARWGVKLDQLAAADPGAYEHHVEVHPGKGHWMDREDAAAVPWMAKWTRNARPTKVVWRQDDVAHKRFYWLATKSSSGGSRVVVSRDGQEFAIDPECGFIDLEIRLDDSMCDLDRPISVRLGEVTLFEGKVDRSIATLVRTMKDRSDPRSMYCAELDVPFPRAAPALPAAEPIEPRRLPPVPQ